MRKTKIICTLGPASSDYETIKAMAEAGMDVVRLNFSHGSHETHLNYIHTIRQVSAELNRPIAILQDLQGPKIRVGEMQDGAKKLSFQWKMTLVQQSDLVQPTKV